jgi:hypothetical protein
MVGFIAATILMACVYSQVAAQEQNETVKYVNFTEETSKGKFIGCQILFKILSRDHVHSSGDLVAVTVSFSSYHFPGKGYNYKMKVCGWDAKGDDFTQFGVQYAFLMAKDVNWAEKEQTSFINDMCFNAVYFGATAVDFGIAFLSDQKQVGYSRAGGTLDAVVQMNFGPDNIRQHAQAKAAMADCMVKLVNQQQD